MANIDALDLNLLRLFDAIHRTRSISRAAEQLGLSQPATSQALTRLRLALRDPLFERAPGGVKPTPRAERLAQSVQAGLALLEQGLSEGSEFDPANSGAELRLHLTDIGEARFLPRLMAELRERAPRMQVQTRALAQAEIAAALDQGRLHFAIGFLPQVADTAQVELLSDRYVLLLREGHPALVGMKKGGQLKPDRLSELEFIAVRSHAETLRILQLLRLEQRVRLVASNFLALPAIVRNSDLAVLMPYEIAQSFEPREGFRTIEPGLPLRDFKVSLHWSRRHEHEPMLRWTRELLLQIFQAPEQRSGRLET
jgi:DNA-binding transcriptional LysR family regulator